MILRFVFLIFHRYKKYGVENLYLPTCDPVHVSLSNLIKGVEFIERVAAQDRCCVVHCKAGMTS